MATILSLLAIVTLVCTHLQHLPVCATDTMLERCNTGWQNRSDENGNVVCYWFEAPHVSRRNLNWRDALWSCRDMEAELFEPASIGEMQWVKEKLLNGTYNGTEWHVYGHRHLYGDNAWHSGQLLDGPFGNRFIHPNDVNEWCLDSFPFSRKQYMSAHCYVSQIGSSSN